MFVGRDALSKAYSHRKIDGPDDHADISRGRGSGTVGEISCVLLALVGRGSWEESKG